MGTLTDTTVVAITLGAVAASLCIVAGILAGLNYQLYLLRRDIKDLRSYLESSSPKVLLPHNHLE